MAPHVIIDKYNLTISLLITIAWQISGFAIAWTLQVRRRGSLRRRSSS